MVVEKEIGKVEKLPYEISHVVEWRIPDFLSAIAALNDTIRYETSDFSVNDGMWKLKIWPENWHFDNESWNVYLYKVNKINYSVEHCYLGIRKADGKIHRLWHNLLKEEDEYYSSDRLDVKELKEKKSEFLPEGVLTIVCTMKLMREIINSPTQHITSEETKLLTWKGLDKLSANFKDLLENKESFDVILKVKDKEYKAHSLVLIARSKVFAATFKHDTLEKKTGVITISDCDPDSFQKFLVYLYSGELGNLSSSSALSLYYTADKYDVEELKGFCIEYLMQCLSAENVCEIAMFADKYDETQLISCVQDFFNKNARKIFETTEWIQLWKKDCRLANKLLIEKEKLS